ncbi:hypothetical protein ZWY2020_032637 [Hordeum vulgare]|nr:hypothetical protein ZWY2020_032637 [Hordeum vulgare]
MAMRDVLQALVPMELTIDASPPQIQVGSTGSGATMTLPDMGPLDMCLFASLRVQPPLGCLPVFPDYPCPDEKRRKDLSERLGISTKKVKFWFQNKRIFTKVKMQQQETQNRLVENKRLKSEHQAIKLAFQNKTCLKCSGVMVQTQGTSEHHRLYTENMRLKEELLHATAYLAEGVR